MPSYSMSEDTRSSAPRPRRVLVLSNPDPGDSSSSDDERPRHAYHNPQASYSSLNRPSTSTVPPPSCRPAKPPLTTDLPHRYPPSRSNPNLSSPSSQSSNAVESTPPPSTPGQTVPSDSSASVFTMDDGTAPGERTETAQPPTRLQKIADVLHLRSRRPSSHRHLGSESSLHSTSPSSASPTVPPLPERVIMVTSDCHAYTTVDITRANSAAFIWERIFTELKIRDEDQSGLCIYRTQIGKVAIGDPLSNDRLLRLVRDQGDSEGSLKFLVCHPQARVREPSLPNSPVKPMPPPPVPFLPVFAPLVPRPRAKKTSQQESVSSEDPAPDAGYEPSVISDDIDDTDNRSTMKPPPHPNSSNTMLSSPPHSARYEDRQSSPASAHTPYLSGVDRHREPLPGQSLPSSAPIHDDFISTPKRQLRRGSDAEAMEQTLRETERVSELDWIRPQDKGISRMMAMRERRERLPSSDDQADKRSDPRIAGARDSDSSYVARKPSPTLSSAATRSPSTKRRPPRPDPNYASRSSQTKQKGNGGKLVPSHFISSHKLVDSSAPTKTLNKAKSEVFKAPKAPLPPVLRPSPSRSTLTTMSGSGTSNSYPRPLELGPRTPRPLPPPLSRLDNINVDTTTYNRAQQPSGQNMLSGYLSPTTQEPYSRPHSASPSQQRYPLPNSDAHRDREEFRPSHQQNQSSTGSGSRFGDVVLREDNLGITLPPSLRPGPYAMSPARTNNQPETPPRSPITSRPSTSNSTSGLTFTSSGTMVPSTFRLDSGVSNQESPATESTIRPDERDKLVWDIRSLSSSSKDSSDDDVGTNETYGTATSDLWSRKPMSEASDALKIPVSSSQQSPPRPTLNVITPSSSGTGLTRGVPPNFPAPPNYLPQLRPAPPRTPKNRHKSSTFEGYTWAHRPPPEDVYDRLEEFFPEHDLDKPVIEANSGGTSPTAVEYAYGIPNNDREKALVRPKKSIRLVAEEHKKRIDRFSRGDLSSDMSVWRKRSTKLWGSRIEEVNTSSQNKASYTKTLPDSPAGGPRPIFKWVRGELIGKGTYGRVYLALNATTGEMIAVKQVEIPTTASDRKDSRQTSFVQALKMESETLKDLDHPHIVQYLGFEETPTFLSIFLEYVPGGSIGSCLRDHGKFDEEVTKSFTGQILEGLEYLHSKNIIHRDLKADNILVEKTGICKISDFGISKRTDDLNGMASTAMQGTVFWMAPEVIHTQKKGYNSKIDIWSVGCVVLEMWAGKRPWSDDEAITVMFKVYQNKQPPPIPPDVILSDLAKNFKDQCFAIDPEERSSATELQLHPYLELPEDWVFNDFK